MLITTKQNKMTIIDEKAFMETFQYFDKSIVVEIIDIFIQEYPDRIASISKDIESKDFARLKFDAHSLKGVISNFFAAEPQQYARELELKGASKDGEGLPELLENLSRTTKTLTEELIMMRQRFVS